MLESSHHGSQRKIFLQTCRKSMKRFKTRIIEKPKIHIRKVNKSNKKEQEFYKNLMECIYKSQCDRLSELLEKKTINLERRDKFGNSPLNT